MATLPTPVEPEQPVATLPWRKATPPPTLTPDTHATGAFLADSVGEAIHLVAIVPDGAITARWFGGDADAAAAWAAERNAAGANVYWTVNRVREGLNDKPKKSDIVAARFAHVDIDPPKSGPWDRDAKLAELTGAAVAPSFLVDSGGGVQAFWRLAEETVRLDDIEAANRGLAHAFAGDACHNIDRLMRVPGTVNRPDKRKRERGRTDVMASILEPDDGVCHAPEILVTRYPAPAAAQEVERPAVDVGPVTTLITADDLGLEPFAPLRMAIEHPPGRDRSDDALAVAGEMVRAGFTDAQVMGVLLNPANPVSAHALDKPNPHRAAARALSKAKGDQSRQDAETAQGASIAATMGVGTAAPALTLQATPYRGREAARIPLRPWVYGRYLLRNTIAVVVAPGGVGKSSLMVGTALALATGRALLATPVWDGPKTVWLWNLEDDGDELSRQIEAACLHYGVGPDDYADRLYVDSGLDGQGLCTAVEGREGVTILKPAYEALAAEIARRGVDVLIVDPFVSSHQVDENANTKIDAIAKEWARLAKRSGCSIVLVHHAGKLQGKKVTGEASRGGSALVAAARSTLILNRMDEDEAKRMGVPAGQRRRYFSVGDDKHNRAPAESVDWYRLEGVSLGNGGMEGGDSVGVVTPWTPPSAAAAIEPVDLRRVQTAIASGSWRFDVRARDAWVGVAVAGVLGIDPDEERARLKDLVAGWLKGGELKTVQAKNADTNWRDQTFVEVGRWAAEVAANSVGSVGK